MCASPNPPPLPDRNSGFWTYLGASVLVAPSAFAASFATVFMHAKVEQLWSDTGLVNSKAQWLMTLIEGFKTHFAFVSAGVLIVLLLLEFKVKPWPRYRRLVIGFLVVLFHSAVLFHLLTLTTSATIAAPLMNKVGRSEALAKPAADVAPE